MEEGDEKSPAAVLFGMEFVKLEPEEWARLQHTVTQLELQPYQKVANEDSASCRHSAEAD